MSHQIRVVLKDPSNRFLRRWSTQNMHDAYEDVCKGRLNISQASRAYGVPRKTLSDRVNGNVPLDCKMGPSTALSKEEEQSLVSYVEYMAGKGFPLTVEQICSYAWAIAKSSNKEDVFPPHGPSEKWWRGFKKRHPHLSLRRPDTLDRGRASNCSPYIIRDYFTTLHKILEDNKLLHQPHLVFNCDERAIDLNGSTQRVVVPRHQKHAHLRSMGTTQHISVHCCVSAAGYALPPMIIFSGGFPGGPYNQNGPDNALYGTSSSGFMDSELYLKWFEKIFLTYTPSASPRLLLQDGHASHINIQLIDLARKNNVILLCLPPHRTHLLQPLDVAMYKSLKSNLSKYLAQSRMLNSDLWVSKKKFSALFKEPFEKSLSMHNIKQGFMKCGIFPFNPDAVDKTLLNPSMNTPVSSSFDLTLLSETAAVPSSSAGLPSTFEPVPSTSGSTVQVVPSASSSKASPESRFELAPPTVFRSTQSDISLPSAAATAQEQATPTVFRSTRSHTSLPCAAARAQEPATPTVTRSTRSRTSLPSAAARAQEPTTPTVFRSTRSRTSLPSAAATAQEPATNTRSSHSCVALGNPAVAPLESPTEARSSCSHKTLASVSSTTLSTLSQATPARTTAITGVTQSSATSAPAPVQSDSYPSGASLIASRPTSSTLASSSSAVPGENLLVKLGLVSASLANILLPPQKSSIKKPSRRVTTARVITSEEYTKQLKAKEKKIEEEEAAKIKRKQEREKKKEEKISQNKRKAGNQGKKITGKKAKINTNICSKCCEVYETSDKLWIGCEGCGRWFHVSCTDLDGIETEEDIEEMDDWFCHICL